MTTTKVEQETKARKVLLSLSESMNAKARRAWKVYEQQPGDCKKEWVLLKQNAPLEALRFVQIVRDVEGDAP